MQGHTKIPPGEKIRSFSVGIRWLGAETCTPPGVLLSYFWRLCSMSASSACLIFVADLIAYRLIYFMSAVVTSNSEAVEWVPCVSAVDGACCS